MRKQVVGLVLLLAVLCVGAMVSAQEVTVEPTVDLTIVPTLVETLLPTTEVTGEPTAEATAQPTSEQAEATAMPTAEATAEMPVEPEVTTTPTDDSAYLRIAQFAPDAESVDVYLNGSVAVRNLKYPSVSRWFAVDPGTYSLAVAPSGQSVDDTVFAPVDVTASADTWQTVVVIGSAESGTLQASVIPEDYSDLMPSTGGLTFVNALEGSPNVNFVRGDVVFYAQVGFPGPDTATSSSSLLIDAGIFDVSVTEADDPTNVFAERAGLEMQENAYTLVALIGTLDESRLYVLTTDRSEVQIVRGLLPKPGQLLDAMRANENLTAFAAALESAGLSDLLSGSEMYTILAPANFAFDDSASMTAEQQEALRGYIVEGKYTSAELVDAATLTTLAGTTLSVTTEANGILVNGVQVIDVNIPATNGVIHMLNGLLTPAR